MAGEPRKRTTSCRELDEPGQSGTRHRVPEEGTEPKVAINPPPMPGKEYRHDTIPVPELPSREWIASHLHELAERVRQDLEVVAFEAKWDVFNRRYTVNLTLQKEEGGS